MPVWKFIATEAMYKKFRPHASWPTWNSLIKNRRGACVENGLIALVVDPVTNWVRLATPSQVDTITAVTPDGAAVAALAPMYAPLVDTAVTA
jgi:hypothetical protein